MKFNKTLFFFMGMFYAGALNANDNFWSQDFIEEEIVWVPTTENKMRDICFTNVFQSISTNGFVVKKLTKRMVSLLSKELNNDEVFEQGAEFQNENGNVIFEIFYFTTTNKVDGGRLALVHSTFFYTTMAFPPKYQQYQDGPGNLCLLYEGTDTSDSTKIRDIFFCRDNVAVRVENRQGGDVFAFIKLLDACILASSVEDP